MINPRLTGCSDLPAILGLDAYRGPSDVWLRNVHGVEAPRPDWLEEAGRLGNLLEEGIAQRALERMGKDRSLLIKPPSVDHPAGLTGLRYSLDFVTHHEDNSIGLIECKMRRFRSFVREGWGETETEIPIGVAAQVQAQLELVTRDRARWAKAELEPLCDVEVATVAVCIDGSEVRLYRLERDPELGAELVEAMLRFRRDHVDTGIPPAVDGTAGARQALELRYPQASKAVRDATDEERRYIAELIALRDQLAELDFAKGRIEQELQLRIGHDAGIRADKHTVRWTTRKGYVRHRDVADALARRIALSEAELGEIQDFHRGPPSRVFEVR